MRELKAGALPPRRLREVRDPLTVGTGLLRLPRQHLERRARPAALSPAAGARAEGRDGAQGRRRHALCARWRTSRRRSSSRCATATRIGVESNDETTAAAVAKYPDKFVGFAYCRSAAARLHGRCCVHAIEDLELKGVKFGPIYNGVALSDPRLEPVLRVSAAEEPAADHAHGDDLCPQRAGRDGPRDPCRAGGAEVPRPRRWCSPIWGTPGTRRRSSSRASSRTSSSSMSALFYRPWQYYNILICAQEYGITDKIFFGTDFPVRPGRRVGRRAARRSTSSCEGTGLPRVSHETMQHILGSNPFADWWKGDNPLG